MVRFAFRVGTFLIHHRIMFWGDDGVGDVEKAETEPQGHRFASDKQIKSLAHKT